MCLRKKRYHTFDFAQGVADRFGQSVYFCPFCSGFHCTSRKTENDKGSKP
jgi:hypothetical protein